MVTSKNGINAESYTKLILWLEFITVALRASDLSLLLDQLFNVVLLSVNQATDFDS